MIQGNRIVFAYGMLSMALAAYLWYFIMFWMIGHDLPFPEGQLWSIFTMWHYPLRFPRYHVEYTDELKKNLKNISGIWRDASEFFVYRP